MLVYWRVNSIEQQFMLQSASKTVIMDDRLELRKMA